MAGSFKHVLDDKGNYHGTNHLDNMGDMKEAVDEMAFLLLEVRQQVGQRILDEADVKFGECLRGERPWPAWWQPEEEE